MIRHNRLTLLVLMGFVISGVPFPAQAASADDAGSSLQRLRVAIVGFAPLVTDSEPWEVTLTDALSRDQRLTLIDRSIVRSALAGIGYDGSINLSKSEASRLGAAIGCDLFITGKAEAFTRSEQAKESHEEAYAAVMVVDGRSGALIAFDFVSHKASTKEAALQSLRKTLEDKVSGYVDSMIQVRAQSSTARSKGSTPASAESEIIEEIPDEDSPRSTGFKPPEFINRVKPEYTPEAELADITATVEAMAVFRSNGEVGRIELVRWAGFGLDESSERAIRQLRFKSATRDGQPISVRAMIRYNFRRVPSPANKPEQPSTEAPAKPERNLRDLFKPTYRRP